MNLYMAHIKRFANSRKFANELVNGEEEAICENLHQKTLCNLLIINSTMSSQFLYFRKCSANNDGKWHLRRFLSFPFRSKKEKTSVNQLFAEF